MKRIIVASPHDALLTTLELVLRHWGYRVLATSSSERLVQSLQEMTPNLLLFTADIFASSDNRLLDAITNCQREGQPPLILLSEPEALLPPLPCQKTLPLPLDIFELFAAIQQFLEKIPRRNLRLAVKLPGLISRNGSSQFAEILSLSSHGLFVKTALQVKVNETLRIIVPLIGMKQELEIECRVIYCVAPSQENNYLQGFGLTFTETDTQKVRQLMMFLEERLFGAVEKHGDGIEAAKELLHSRSVPLTLRLPPEN